ncbi:MAG: DUF2851 family protein [Sphingobacteriales bacterium]|jgi:hypothetical protein
MNEKLLHFIWQYQIFNSIALTTTQFDRLTILNPGKWNHNQGPDFGMARILINGEQWIGNIELHVRSSDWHLHHHDQDPNYKNVILHVVWQHDLDNNFIPVLELESRVPSLLLSKYQTWSLQNSFISCSGSTGSLDMQIVYPFLKWLNAKRQTQRSKEVMILVESLSGDWEEAFWRQLARSFGHKVNADSFERMAENLPYKILLRHQHNLKQLEALIFGQAGLLHSGTGDVYADELYKEFIFLRRKYKLRRNVFPLYFLRMRPINFPTIRLAQLASLIHHHPDLLRTIKDLEDQQSIKKLLRISAGAYWNTHFRFGEETSFQLKNIGIGLIEKIMINTIIPFVRAYQSKRGKQQQLQYLDEWTSEMKSEYNSIVTGFSNIGMAPRNMEDSQGLLELKKSYCDQLKCLDCAIGRYLLRK